MIHRRHIEQRTQLAKGEVGIEPKKEILTFSQAVKDFIIWIKSEHRDKPNTQQGYQNSCKFLVLFFKEQPLDQIEPQDVERYKIWRGKQTSKHKKILATKSKDIPPIANATLNRELACLRLIFNRHIKLIF